MSKLRESCIWTPKFYSVKKKFKKKKEDDSGGQQISCHV